MAKIPFDLSFQKLPKILYEDVIPTPLKSPCLIGYSEGCAHDMGWDRFGVSRQLLAEWLNGETRLDGDQRISTRYAGHQFGVWAGQLGDGRAVSLGEYLDPHGRRWEIQTKGSGLTPFSRHGDGKAVIRSSVREFLASEAMHALGIPTTRALALITGRDPVQRETLERSALVARVFPSNLRFGHFEYCYHFRDHGALKALTEYARREFFKDCSSVSEMLEQVVLRTADLVAGWQAVGFSHGVMNTDNMSFLGLTIDYGPFGFMEDTDLDHVPNHSDPQGRYRYQNQPWTALWNLDRLFVCFTDMVPTEELRRILERFEPRFLQTWLKKFCEKLGLQKVLHGDHVLIEELLATMSENQVDFTSFFRNLNWDLREKWSLSPLSVMGEKGFREWFQKYEARAQEEGTQPEERERRSRQKNPKFILKNYIAQEVIQDIESDQPESLQDWLKILASPFDEHPDWDRYAQPTPVRKKNFVVSCSS